jgi:hypothetical protein
MKSALLTAAVLCLLASGCTDRDRPPARDEDGTAAAPPSAAAPTRAGPSPGEQGREAREGATPTAGDAEPTEAWADAQRPQAEARPPATGTTVGATRTPPSRDWTAAIVEMRPSAERPVVLRDVRVGRNEGFDRVVFEFEGEQLPGYHLEYIDAPVRRCGSGTVAPIAGQGWLQVRLERAQAHTEAGEPTMLERELKPQLPIVLEAEQVCDFEGQVEWVLGNRKPNRYRVMELSAPTRLVVDVRH